MDNFIEHLPKAELHLHIEGSFEPELMFAIAKRNNIDIPYKSVSDVKKAYQFSCLEDFLQIYYQSARVLLYEQDFYDLTFQYLESSAKQEVKHVEIMFDPQTHTERGVAFHTVINGITKACDAAKAQFGITTILIMSFLRHLSEEAALETLEQALPFKDKIMAIGLDSSELGNPPEKFKHAFHKAKEHGFKLVAHAGEEGPAQYVWDALNILNIERIDHGNNCLEDPELVEEINKRNMALTVCPLSNLSLKVVSDLTDHPLQKMMDLGLNVTINSDDPAYFGGNLNKNYKAIQKALNLSKEALYLLAKNSFEYSFLEKAKKEQYLSALETYYKNNK